MLLLLLLLFSSSSSSCVVSGRLLLLLLSMCTFSYSTRKVKNSDRNWPLSIIFLNMITAISLRCATVLCNKNSIKKSSKMQRI